MAERKPFLLRLDPETFAALQAWAADDLRSVNGQVEFLLRRALRDAGRLSGRGASAETPAEAEAGSVRAGAGTAGTGEAKGPEREVLDEPDEGGLSAR